MWLNTFSYAHWEFVYLFPGEVPEMVFLFSFYGSICILNMSFLYIYSSQLFFPTLSHTISLFSFNVVQFINIFLNGY